MSFPYALLHFEAQRAKERLAQVFHVGPGVRSDSLSPTLTKGVPVMNEQSGASSVIRFFASPGKNVQLHGPEAAVSTAG